MATYEITAPNGEVFEVDAPDGATEAEVMAYAQAEFAKMQKQVKRSAPGSDPLPPYSDMIKDGAANVVMGLVRGGPMGALIEGGKSAIKNQGMLFDRAAYKAGGAVTDALADIVPAEVAGGAGSATNFATQAIPALLGGILGKATDPAFKGAGRWLMQSALKPDKLARDSGRAARGIEYMLEKGAGVSGGGANKMQGIIDDANTAVQGLLQGNSSVVADVRGKAGDEILGLLGDIADTPAPTQATKIVNSVWDDFVANHPSVMPVLDAQRKKVAAQQSLAGAFMDTDVATREAANMAIARGYRKAIEEAVPEVAPLNAEASKAHNALKLIADRLNTSGNRDVAGLVSLSPNTYQAIAMLADRSPWIKSLLARAAYSGNLGLLGGAGAGAAYGAATGQPE